MKHIIRFGDIMLESYRKNIIIGTTDQTKEILPELAKTLAHEGVEELKKSVWEEMENSKK